MDNIHTSNFRNVSFIMDQDGNIISMDQKDIIKPFVEKKNNTCTNIINDFNFHEDIMKRLNVLEEQVNNLNCQQKNYQSETSEDEKVIKEKKIEDLKGKARASASKRIDREKLIGMSELKKRLGIGDHYAYELVNSGEIEAYRIGNKWRIPERAIGDYMKRCSNRS